MAKPRNKKNLKNPHISYKYIIGFCITFAFFNFFIEKIAIKNEGKNNPQIQNIRFNQVQSYKSNIGKQKFSKITVKNNIKITENISEKTLSPDFKRNKKIHNSWLITHG